MATSSKSRQELQGLKARVLALEQERDTLSAVLNTNPAVTYRARASGDFGAIFVSAGLTAQLGHQPRDFTEDAAFWADHVHPEDQPRVLAEMARAVETGSGVFEYRFQHQDGSYRWMRDECHIETRNESQELVGYWIDITARKEAELALLATEEAIPDMFFGLNREGIFLSYVPAKGLEPFVPPEDFLGRNIRDVLLAAVAEAALVHIERASRTGDVQLFEYALDLPGGRYEYEARTVPKREGEVLILVRDVTARRTLEQEKDELIRKLSGALEEVKTLSGLLPLCAWCKRVRDDQGYWKQVETFLVEHTDAQVSHGICPECFAKRVGKLEAEGL